MANRDVLDVFQDCLNTIHINTKHPENFLSLQDDVAAEFTSLTKTLYDLHKTYETGYFKGSPLAQLVVNNFDEEQIWQELELQNAPMLKYFENSVKKAVLDETLTFFEDDDDDAEEEERDADSKENKSDYQNEMVHEDRKEQPTRKSKLIEDDTVAYTDEDSDIDFNVDAWENEQKNKKHTTPKDSRTNRAPSEVDDQFFKLSEMESFLNDMDRREGKDVEEEEEDIDYFQDFPSDDEDDLDLDKALSSKTKKKQSTLKSSMNLKYKDFFDAVDSAPAEAEDQSGDERMDGMPEDSEEDIVGDGGEDDGDIEGSSKYDERNRSDEPVKRVTFNLSGDESEGEDMEDIFGGKATSSGKSDSKSSFEKRQEKMSERIEQLEKAALGEKPWQLFGEVTAHARPENSILEENVEFEHNSRMVPAVTEETTQLLEDIIKQRIKDQVFDDVVRKEKPKEEAYEYKKRLTLDHEKSKLSLAEVYEQEYLKQTQQKTEEQENPDHIEIQKLMDGLFLKIDALSNFHFTPKPSIPEIKVVSNLPSITMEEVAPVSASDATLLAPEEIKEKTKAGDILGDTEKTSTDKKRERRKKKTIKRFKIKEKEKRQKLKEATKVGENRKASKAEVAEQLKKLTKGGKATILKDEGKDKSLRSSQAFFTQLQDQVKSQIKTTKDQSSKKKKHKDMSVTKLKL